ncbi:MAG: hypothetical protein ACYSYM_00095, partial [Planctomycetota bacterium]
VLSFSSICFLLQEDYAFPSFLDTETANNPPQPADASSSIPSVLFIPNQPGLSKKKAKKCRRAPRTLRSMFHVPKIGFIRLQTASVVVYVG